MLHDQRSRHWRQRLWLPSTAPTGAGPYISSLGSLDWTSAFDHEQVAALPALHLVTSGAGRLDSAGEGSVAIAAGDAFLIVPGERARYREDLRRPWRYAWLTIDGPGAMDACAAAGFPGRRRVLRGGASPAALAVLDDLRRAFAGASCSPCTAHAGLWRLAEAMSSHNQAPPRQDPEETLRRLMTNGFDEGLSIGAIAARLGVDRTTLFRRFRQRYGCNPRTYLAQVRLDRAHTLLGDGERRIADVARSCGYGDARAFARAYRRRHGCSPSGR